MFAQLMPSLRMLLVMSALTGVIYPLVVTGVAKVAFPRAANGSLIVSDGKTLGSDLIGQPFDDPKYFWSRPSATSPQPYNGMASSGSNLGPRNPALADAVKDRIKALRDAFEATMKDPDFLAEAARQKLIINPVSGEKIASLIERIYAMPRDVLDRVAAVSERN